MAIDTEIKFDCPVVKGDLLEKSVDGRDYSDVFMCVSSDDELFVVGRAKFRKVETENSIEYEVCGCSWENLRAFKNDKDTLVKNGFEIIDRENA